MPAARIPDRLDKRRAERRGTVSAADLDDVRAVFAAVAPIVGTPRVVHAAGNVFRALGVAYELAELKEFDVAEK